MKFLIGFLLLAAMSASGAIIFTPGNIPSAETNVLLNGTSGGTLVTGSPAGVPGVTVNFTSNESLSVPSSGQARIEAASGALNFISIGLTGGATFGDLIFNPFIGGGSGTGGSSTVTAVGTVSGSHTYDLNIANGNNFLTVTAVGERLTGVSINSPGGFNDLRQVRLSDVGTPVGISATPEPSTVVMFAIGLAAVALSCRRAGRAR